MSPKCQGVPLQGVSRTTVTDSDAYHTFFEVYYFKTGS